MYQGVEVHQLICYLNMPKTRRDRSVSYERSRGSILARSSSNTIQPPCTCPNTTNTKEDLKEWEEARCPVCMEHPHNAVLLVCSSYGKGCRPYMCDTSYRHSNCLDQFRKSFAGTSSTTPMQGLPSRLEESSNSVIPELVVVGSLEESEDEGPTDVDRFPSMHKLRNKLACPLCRGLVSGWVVVESARCFMNAKTRSCACETCEFTGNYTDLRKHARLEHPLVRPSEADPERQRTWRRLERQRDIGDVLSTIQSSLGEDRADEDFAIDNPGLLTVFFLIRIFRPGGSPRSSSWSSASRARARVGSGARRRSVRLWGENYDGESSAPPAGEDDPESSDGGSITWRRRVHRRTTPDDQI